MIKWLKNDFEFTPFDEALDALKGEMDAKTANSKRVYKKRAAASEAQIQAAFAKWAHLSRAKYPALSRLYAIENGGYRTKATAGRLKAMGIKRGISDMFLSAARGGWHGFYIEFKTTIGRQTDEQREWELSCAEYGYKYAVVRSLDEAIGAVLEYLGSEK